MALPTDGKTLLRCSTCTILHTTVWETARHMVHSNGEVPTKRVLSQLLTSSCENEVTWLPPSSPGFPPLDTTCHALEAEFAGVVALHCRSQRS